MNVEVIKGIEAVCAPHHAAHRRLRSIRLVSQLRIIVSNDIPSHPLSVGRISVPGEPERCEAGILWRTVPTSGSTLHLYICVSARIPIHIRTCTF